MRAPARAHRDYANVHDFRVCTQSAMEVQIKKPGPRLILYVALDNRRFRVRS